MASLKLALPPGCPIDATLFTCLMENRLPSNFPSHIKYDLKRRLFSLGTKMMKVRKFMDAKLSQFTFKANHLFSQIHNCLLQPEVEADGDKFVKGIYSGLAHILRKCVTRLKYVVTDSTRNEVIDILETYYVKVCLTLAVGLSDET